MHARSLARQGRREQQALLSYRLQNTLTIVAFLLPSVLIFILFVVYPMAQSAYFSLFRWKGFGPATDFVGLDNYARILSDDVFLLSLRNAGVIVGLSLGIQLPLSLLLALLVGRDLPGRTFFRTIFFLPFVFSEVITGIIWASMYNPDPQFGFINALLTLIPGLRAHPWLGDPTTVLPAIFLAMTWKYFGFYMLLYMAGLQSIPLELEEAATIDGATRAQTLLLVTLPLLGSTIRTTVYLSVLGSIQQFGLIWIMSQGGPAHASESLATYLYRFGFIRFYLGYGAAVAVVMFAICLAFSLAYQYFVAEREAIGVTH